MTEEPRKTRRDQLKAGERRVSTSVSLTNEERIQLRRLGGSKWLRNMLKKEANGIHT